MTPTIIVAYIEVGEGAQRVRIGVTASEYAEASDMHAAEQAMRRHLQAYVIPHMGQARLGNRTAHEGQRVHGMQCEECGGSIATDRRGERACEACGLVTIGVRDGARSSTEEDDESDAIAPVDQSAYVGHQRDNVAEARRAKLLALIRAGVNNTADLRRATGASEATLRKDRQVLLEEGRIAERFVNRRRYIEYVPPACPRRAPVRAVEPDRSIVEPARHSVAQQPGDMAYVAAEPFRHLEGTYGEDRYPLHRGI